MNTPLISVVLTVLAKTDLWRGQHRKSPSASQLHYCWSFWAQYLNPGLPGILFFFFFLDFVSTYSVWWRDLGFLKKSSTIWNDKCHICIIPFFVLPLSSSPHPTEAVKISNFLPLLLTKGEHEQRNEKKVGDNMGLNILIKTTFVIWVSIFTTNLAQHH